MPHFVAEPGSSDSVSAALQKSVFPERISLRIPISDWRMYSLISRFTGGITTICPTSTCDAINGKLSGGWELYQAFTSEGDTLTFDTILDCIRCARSRSRTWSCSSNLNASTVLP